MIFNAIIFVLIMPVMAFLDLLPDMPDLPQQIIDGGDWIILQFQSAKSVIDMLLGATFVNAVLIVIVGVINFTWIYNSVMWVLRKLPFLSID